MLGADAWRRIMHMAFQCRLLAGLVVTACWAIAGCNGSGQAETASSVRYVFSGDYPMRVVCTTGMVADLVQQVGGERVAVGGLMGEGVDPHIYDPPLGDVQRVNAADVVFYSGLHLEGKMADIFARRARRKPTYAVADSIPRDRLISAAPGQRDPHVWFDVALWREASLGVGQTLAEIDPTHADEYQARAARYAAELTSLDQWCRSQLAQIPLRRRVMVTGHDAFGYFGRAYEIEVHGVQGVSTDSQASLAHVNELVDFLVKRQVPAVFIESTLGDQNVRSLVEGCAARGHAVRIGGRLFSDAMGGAGTPEGTYIGMVRHNVDTIVHALQ